MFDTLNDEVLIIIMSYLNHKDSINFLLCNKYLKTLFYKSGYLKGITFGTNYKNRDPNELFLLCCKHEKTLKTLFIYNLNNPSPWIPISWPKSVNIYYSCISEKLSPSLSRTEKLTISIFDFNFIRNKTLKIDWKKFPSLKNIYFRIHDLDINGIEECKNLEIINITIIRVKGGISTDIIFNKIHDKILSLPFYNNIECNIYSDNCVYNNNNRRNTLLLNY
jgi:hypothetical protein